MRPFEFMEPATLEEVLGLLQSGGQQARLLAGGSDLLGEIKDDVVHYERLVSLAGVKALRDLRQDETGLHLGALVTLAQLEYEPRLQGPYRILAEAARGVATPEIRHQGTLGGNLCQRPRCLYYRSALSPCLKKGGADCPAVTGPYQDYLSILVIQEIEASGFGRAVVNPRADEGQLSSLLAGLDAIDRPGVEAALVTLVDVPLIGAAAIRVLLARAAASGAPILRAVHRGAHGHPVIFKRRLFDALRAADPAVGAKAVVRAAGVEDVEVDDAGVVEDVDTPADYARLFGKDVAGLITVAPPTRI